MITKDHIRWTKRHDWYVDSGHVSSTEIGILVREDNGEIVVFTDFKELVRWAGY